MKKILSIQPGPCYKTENPKIKAISFYFKGTTITYSDSDEITCLNNYSGFSFECLKLNYYLPNIIKYLNFLIYTIRFCIKSRKSNVKYDLVITYDPLKTGIIGIIASRILNCKFITEINGTYHSKYNFYDKSILFSSANAFLYKCIMKLVFSFSHGIKYQYPGQISFFEKKLKNHVIDAFPNLVQLDIFKNIREDKLILIVGFPFWRKGIDIGINAFKHIAFKYPDWKLKILGWYPDKTLLNKYIANHPQIFYHKPVMPPEMPEHIGTCAIVCCPSRSEGVPRVLMEAMKSGKPIIGSSVDGIPVLIKNGYNGFLFENENVYQLANRLELLISNPELRKFLGRNGSNLVQKEFSKEQYTKKLISLYNLVIG